MISALLACSLTPLFFQEATGDDATEPPRASGRHFEVACYGCPPASAEAVLAEVEEAAAAVHEALSLENRPLGDPLPIHVYASKANFDRAVKDRLEDESALLLLDDRSAHFALDPQLTEEQLAELGLPWNTRRVIAAEAARFVMNQILGDDLGGPSTWLRDGLPAWAGERAAAASREGYALGRDPYYGWGQNWVREEVPERGLEIREIVCGESPGWHRSRETPLHHNVVRFLLRDDNRDFSRTLIAETREAWRSGSTKKALEKRIGKLLNKSGWKKLQRGFVEYCSELEADWDLDCGMLDVQGERWVHVAPTSRADWTYSQGTVGKKGIVLSGSLELHPGQSPDLGIIFLNDDKKYFLIAFNPLSETLGVLEWDKRKESWERQALVAAPFHPREEFTFVITAKKKRFSITINGEELWSMPLGRRKTEGRWGLYAAPGAAGVWKNVRVEEGP